LSRSIFYGRYGWQLELDLKLLLPVQRKAFQQDPLCCRVVRPRAPNRHLLHPLQKPSGSHEGKAGSPYISPQQLEAHASRTWLKPFLYETLLARRYPEGQSCEGFSRTKPHWIAFRRDRPIFQMRQHCVRGYKRLMKGIFSLSPQMAW